MCLCVQDQSQNTAVKHGLSVREATATTACLYLCDRDRWFLWYVNVTVLPFYISSPYLYIATIIKCSSIARVGHLNKAKAAMFIRDGNKSEDKRKHILWEVNTQLSKHTVVWTNTSLIYPIWNTYFHGLCAFGLLDQNFHYVYLLGGETIHTRLRLICFYFKSIKTWAKWTLCTDAENGSKQIHVIYSIPLSPYV